jgi:hypothetical protein
VTDPSRYVTPYLAAAASAIDLVAASEVAARWPLPSALPQLSVGGLAAHLLGQVLSTEATLDEPRGDDRPVPLLAHYTKVKWRGKGLAEPANAGIRAGGEQLAKTGPEALVEEARATHKRLAARLPDLAHHQVVQPPWTGWTLTLDDFLVTRLMEIAVHSDDLAVSVDLPTPELPEVVTVRVRHLLVDLAAQRHGSTAVLRGLSRVERAPSSITAF